MKVLANGDIVPDDDPRATASSSNSRQRNPNAHRGGIPPTGGNPNQPQYQHGPGGQQVGMFQTINQTLLGYGIPRLNVGETVIEPIVTVGLVLAVVFFGVQGLLFGLLLFAASQWSTNGPPEFVGRFLGTQQPQQGGNNGNGNRRTGGNTSRSGGWGSGGGGHRLGRD